MLDGQLLYDDCFIIILFWILTYCTGWLMRAIFTRYPKQGTILILRSQKKTCLTVWMDLKGQVHSLWPLVHGITSRTTKSCKERHQWSMKHWTSNCYDCDWFKKLWETIGYISCWDYVNIFRFSYRFILKCIASIPLFINFDYSDWDKVLAT